MNAAELSSKNDYANGQDNESVEFVKNFIVNLAHLLLLPSFSKAKISTILFSNESEIRKKHERVIENFVKNESARTLFLELSKSSGSEADLMQVSVSSDCHYDDHVVKVIGLLKLSKGIDGDLSEIETEEIQMLEHSTERSKSIEEFIGSRLQVIEIPLRDIEKYRDQTDQDAESSIQDQSSHDTSAVYDSLHNIIHFGVSAFYQAFINHQYNSEISLSYEVNQVNNPKSSQEMKKLVSEEQLLPKKKLAELEMSLVNLQNSSQVNIPEVKLYLHDSWLLGHLVSKSNFKASNGASENQKEINEHIFKWNLSHKSIVELVEQLGEYLQTSSDPEEKKRNQTILDSLQQHVNQWVKQIHELTKLVNVDDTKLVKSSAYQEINFWVNAEFELLNIERQLNSVPVQVTLELLKYCKRFHATVSFMADTGLKQALEKVQKYNILMRDFPIDQLFSSVELSSLSQAVESIIQHFIKKVKLSNYPIKRCLHLIDSITVDMDKQLRIVLSNLKLMQLDFTSFHSLLLYEVKNGIYRVWDENILDLTSVLREISRKRSDKFVPIKFENNHLALQQRLDYVFSFRKKHWDLRSTISKVSSNNAGIGLELQSSDVIGIAELNSMLSEVDAAYELIKPLDILDTSEMGTKAFSIAERHYQEKITKVENVIIQRLRDRLGLCKNANEMFRVFSKFNALLVRPKIRGAIQEYQTQLIENVKKDIERLQMKFKSQYKHSQAYKMSKIRDIPPVSGSIIWAKQIERQLNILMKKVEDVLGVGWESYVEGQKLNSEYLSFLKKLDQRQIYEKWLSDVNSRNLQIAGPIFKIDQRKKVLEDGQITGKTILELNVNFDERIIMIFKEVRNLLSMKFLVPHSVISFAKDAKKAYPYAVSISELLRTYHTTNELLNDTDSRLNLQILVSNFQNKVRSLLKKGMNLKWEMFVEASPSVSNESGEMYLAAGESQQRAPCFRFVSELENAISSYHLKVIQLIELERNLESYINELQNCTYEFDKFSRILSKVQEIVDKLNLDGYSNLHKWVSYLNSSIEEVLEFRMKEGLRIWLESFERNEELHTKSSDSSESVHDSNIHNENLDKMQRSLLLRKKYPLNFNEMSSELKIKNQSMLLDPPIQRARSNWYAHLQNWIGVIVVLPVINSTNFQIDIMENDGKFAAGKHHSNTYHHILSKIINQDQNNIFSIAIEIIEKKAQEVESYVKIWFQYQSLWDLEMNTILEVLADDLKSWRQLMNEVRSSRAALDTSESQKNFANLQIKFGKIQSKISGKYDQWQKELLIKFANIVSQKMGNLKDEILTSRASLEKQTSLDNGSTASAVALITTIEDTKKKIAIWKPLVESLQESEKLLVKQRFQLPNYWIYFEGLFSQWKALLEIFHRKNSIIQSQLSNFQSSILDEEKKSIKKISQLLEQWHAEKPLKGNESADDALEKISKFEISFESSKNGFDLLMRAKNALGLDSRGEERLVIAMQEAGDLKDVWSALSVEWKNIASLKEILWSSLVPKKLKSTLNEIQINIQEMPTKMRQYSAYEFLSSTIKDYVDTYYMIVELKGDSVKERHWNQLMKIFGIFGKIPFSQITLGDVWEAGLRKNEKQIKEVLTVARGEMALEDFLSQVADTWESYSIELVNYRSRLRLIKGWDELFSKCAEHISSLATMKMSPYYRIFEDQARSWEKKLNLIHNVFDLWIDVQRQFVYLEGIFHGNADIKALLPVETSRFQNINTEFAGLMKKVYKSQNVLDIISIPNVQKSLERLVDLLYKIQKALGEYLEKERSLFPRFYFVGDEDLLEIIGNSRDIPRIQKHFKKMFAGINSVSLAKDESEIKSVISKEGENLELVSVVKILEKPINQWLGELERVIRLTVCQMAVQAFDSLNVLMETASFKKEEVLSWVETLPAQALILSLQIKSTSEIENCLESGSFEDFKNKSSRLLHLAAELVLDELSTLTRRKIENLITELVHERDMIRHLCKLKCSSRKDFSWLQQLRFYLDKKEPTLKKIRVEIANSSFDYGFEYLGACDRLVQTPLTQKCYLSLTQALTMKYGGSPFGPAGTGKTETVKSLGAQLGRFVLVFCCDENFDFQSVGRIFFGICQVGAWGCFDEFNRLEEKMLSAVSSQIQSIQESLRDGKDLELLGKNLKLNLESALFVTMNPGYAGRSNLPDNLKKLFRPIAMMKPDRDIICQVLLYSQGFKDAEEHSEIIVPFFDKCQQNLSKQSHYDFGLRALKSVVSSAGRIKRVWSNSENSEKEIILRSIREAILPKLIPEDLNKIADILKNYFSGTKYRTDHLKTLMNHVKEVAESQGYLYESSWVEKVMQLYQIQSVNHGLMMVGPSGTAKTSTWNVLLEALSKFDGLNFEKYVIDPKAITKDILFGSMDHTTREWTDGLFTGILRKIVDNVRGESNKRHWIIFDGDVDPEWVENLNSLLDDNKIFTLPNGERLPLPENVRILFEVENLEFATLATVSRCGMVWYSDDIVSNQMLFHRFLEKLRRISLDSEYFDKTTMNPENENDESESLSTQRACADILSPYLSSDGLVDKCLKEAIKLDHVMEFTRIRALETLFTLLKKIVSEVLEHNASQPDLPLSFEIMESYVTKKLVYSIIWSFCGDSPMKDRKHLGEFIRNMTTIDLPVEAVIDCKIDIDIGWQTWESIVPAINIESSMIDKTDVIIPTVDTMRHEDIIYSWMADHKPVILCGPPGSGKTMSLFNSLRKLPETEVVGLNFSSSTTPELLMQTFEQYCDYQKGPNGTILSPKQQGKWLVIFCDEINLPLPDKYGTQKVISFLRQLIERSGFWSPKRKHWVKLEKIQVIGACNPPTDAGRITLNQRFLRHVRLVLVDYPEHNSLKQIFGTFNRAILKPFTSLRPYAESLTDAMINLYEECRDEFTVEAQPHYIFSPRELTRWVRGIYETIRPVDILNLSDLVKIWAHEGLRLFRDRLISEDEKQKVDHKLDSIANKYFQNIETSNVLERPILFSKWLSKNYVPVNQDILRDYVNARLRIFCEEELEVQLVLFDDVLEQVLRIDRVFHQVQGHLLLIGSSGCGKTILTRFVAWMNGLSTYQINFHQKYSAQDFDEDIRNILKRTGCKGEKICFLLDETNVRDPGFLERLNTLLANGEIPGLFEGDEMTNLMSQIEDSARSQGLILENEESRYEWFIQQILRNLHVVFTMTPPSKDGLQSQVTASPALFNRCVLNWMGDWSDQALYQTCREMTSTLDLEEPLDFESPSSTAIYCSSISLPMIYRDAVANAFVMVHKSLHEINSKFYHRYERINYITPRHYLDFISHFVKLFDEKREQLEDNQRHLNMGLEKLEETYIQVEELRKSLAEKNTVLEEKSNLANQKLKTMVAEQQEAEKNKSESLKMQKFLVNQNKEIEDRKKIVMEELAEAEPAVLEAQQSVRNIKKQHLTEVRSMTNPPAAVKLAMESVCSLLGNQIDSWKNVQQVIRKDDFISSIVNYQTDMMTPQMRQKMKEDYLSNPDFNFESVNRASKACGPLVQWVIAQVNYSEMLDKVGPLRSEVQKLEKSAEKTKKEALVAEEKVIKLEKSILMYKEEYAALISETQALKSEMETVKEKVDRSIHLLKNLESEKVRWKNSTEDFDNQISSIVGNTLVSAAFLAYAGYYDKEYRDILHEKWVRHLQQSEIIVNSDLSISEYLSSISTRQQWFSNGLPDDELSIENVIMMTRGNRYPLIIDPTEQAVGFLKNEFKDKRIIVTTFLDNSFMKNLESAVRFGSALVVRDAEYFNPIINPVLNRETRKIGGRVMIKLGQQEIDFSPMFKLFLLTKNSGAEFPPEICSRVTFVNFTKTPRGLQNQCLNSVLKSERPDIDRKRSNLLKAQGEYQARLRNLEDQLLKSISESQVHILEDNAVIQTLERLQQEAQEISKKVADTDQVMEEIEKVTKMYTPFAETCSAIYFSGIRKLEMVNRFYQFSLVYFFEIFNDVLQLDEIRGIREPSKRLDMLQAKLFCECYSRLIRSMLYEDHFVWALLLAQIYSELVGIGSLNVDEIYHLFNQSLEAGDHSDTATGDSILSSKQWDFVKNLSKSIEFFRKLPVHIKENPNQWKNFVSGPGPMPKFWNESGRRTSASLNAGDYLHKLLIYSGLKQDQFSSEIYNFVSILFNAKNPQKVSKSGEALDFSNSLSRQSTSTMSLADIKKIIDTQIDFKTPISFCSVPGLDASHQIEALAHESSINLVSVAMGSPESQLGADKAINEALSNGWWVLIKNIHLDYEWLQKLQKKIEKFVDISNEGMGNSIPSSFKLFVTMEMDFKVSHGSEGVVQLSQKHQVLKNFLRYCRIFVFERVPGLKDSLVSYLKKFDDSASKNPQSPEISSKFPAERSRVIFMVCWIHAVIQERLNYVPVGWKKFYEFNDVDFECAVKTVNDWMLRSVSASKSSKNLTSNISPEKIAWNALRTIISQCVYGGRIDEISDQKVLDSLVNYFLRLNCFDSRNFSMFFSENPINASRNLYAPEGTRMEQFINWAQESLTCDPQQNEISVSSNDDSEKSNEFINKIKLIGLPADADKYVEINRSKNILAKLRALSATAN